MTRICGEVPVINKEAAFLRLPGAMSFRTVLKDHCFSRVGMFFGFQRLSDPQRLGFTSGYTGFVMQRNAGFGVKTIVVDGIILS